MCWCEAAISIEARSVLATVPEGTEGRDRPLTRLQMMEEAAGMGELAEIEAGLAKNPDDLELRYQAAVVEAVRDHYEAALDHAMHILQNGPQIPRRHRPHHAGPDLRAAAQRLRSGEELSAPHVRADALTCHSSPRPH